MDVREDLSRLDITAPLAVILTLVVYLALNRTHIFKIGVSTSLAFTAAVPWGAYLVDTGVWSYAPEARTGPMVLGVPIVEMLALFLQTYITSLVYILLNITLVHCKYLSTQQNPPVGIALAKLTGQVFLVLITFVGAYLIHVGGKYTYLGLILNWAPPFALFVWTVAGSFILALPRVATVAPILIPTVYFLIAETCYHGSGGRNVDVKAKLGCSLFGTLDIEEAIIALMTNTLIVFTLAALDMYLAVIDAFPSLFPGSTSSPTLATLFKACFTGTKKYDMERIQGIYEADNRLRAKSRSFHLASFAFSGRLRLDLILLYSFCRMADDLIDNAESEEEIMSWNSKLIRYLDIFYGGKDKCRSNVDKIMLNHLIDYEFPASARSALRLLPTHILPGGPFYALIEGFRMDAQFNITKKDSKVQFPIEDESDLWKYSNCVAGTIGQLCNALIVHHCQYSPPENVKPQLDLTAMSMGIALQLVNIARDISVDALMGRVYLPTTWLKAEGLTPEDIIAKPDSEVVQQLRRRILDLAFAVYHEMRPSMEHLPKETRGPMILVVESYMEIGRVLREKYHWTLELGKATVPTRRRVFMAIKTLLSA